MPPLIPGGHLRDPPVQLPPLEGQGLLQEAGDAQGK
jgi:hypothetical protein